MPKEDSIDVTILPDGTIRSEVNGTISPANHSNAEAWFRLLDELTGTKGKRTRRSHTHVHTHEHDHEQAGH